MLVYVPQQTVSLTGQYRCQAFPAFKREHPLADAFAAFCTLPGIEEIGRILLYAATDPQLRRKGSRRFSGAVSAAPRGGRRGSPRRGALAT